MSYPETTASIGLDEYYNWAPRTLLGPLILKSKSSDSTSFGDPFGIFRTVKTQQNNNLANEQMALSDYVNSEDNADNWIKALTLDDWPMNKAKNGQDFSGEKKDAKNKSWWSKFWEKRPNNGRPTDPANYGINPHGPFPGMNQPVKANMKTKTESTPLLGNMKKFFGRLWKPNSSNDDDQKQWNN